MSPRRAIPQQQKRRQLPPWLIVSGLVVFIVLAVLVGADFLSKAQPTSAPSSSTLTFDGITASGRTLGDAKAPIAFVEYSDFQ